MSQDVSRHPLDFDTLDKGTVLPAALVAKAVKAEPGTPEYSLRTLNLVSSIKLHFETKRNLIVAVKVHKDAIHILTDSEATEYCYDQMQSAIRKSLRRFNELAEVDRTQLAEDEKQEHDRRLINGGKQVQALATSKSGIRISAYVRTTPGLPAPKEPVEAPAPAKTTD